MTVELNKKFKIKHSCIINVPATYYLNGNYRLLRRKKHIEERQDENNSFVFFDVESDKKATAWPEGDLVYPITFVEGTVIEVKRVIAMTDWAENVVKIDVLSSPDKLFTDLNFLALLTEEFEKLDLIEVKEA